jgi:hypothetical protein
MVKYVERRTIIQEKRDYLKKFPPPSGLAIGSTHKLGSWDKESPMSIQRCSGIISLPLVLSVRTFLHDMQYADGLGHRHRVKQKKSAVDRKSSGMQSTLLGILEL